VTNKNIGILIKILN